MGKVVNLEAHRAARRPRVHGRPEFAFDLADPFSYFAAERVQRAFATVDWVPASAHAVRGPTDPERLRAEAEARAGRLRLPLSWPVRFPVAAPMAMRATTHAIELGRGGDFAVAAGRLAFSGGFDLEHPATIAEAAAAAGLAPGPCLEAASDPSRDADVERATRELQERGAAQLPVLRFGDDLFAGEEQVAAVSRSARAWTVSARAQRR